MHVTDWIFQGNPKHHELHVPASRQQWWSTPHYRDAAVAGDRVWLQIVGRDHPGIYYIATITTPTYEHPDQPLGTSHGRWRTDIRFDYLITPPLLRLELLGDPQLGSFRPFRGFQGSTVPVPADIATVLWERAAPRLEAFDAV